MNTYLNELKSWSRVFGARQIAQAFRDAANPARTCKRKFMARSHVFFAEPPNSTPHNSNLGAQLIHDSLSNGHVGVKGLLYFYFSFSSKEGNQFSTKGYALVREHSDPNRPNNPT